MFNMKQISCTLSSAPIARAVNLRRRAAPPVSAGGKGEHRRERDAAPGQQRRTAKGLRAQQGTHSESGEQCR